MDSKSIRMVSVPKAVIKRLPMYHRFLNELAEKRVERISSRELSQLMGITSSQLRQDLSYFGEFGQQGYGYSVEILHRAIGEILGLEKTYQGVIIGGGNIGKAIANYPGFYRRGLYITAVLDIDPQVIGTRVGGDIPVLDIKNLPDFLTENKVEVGIIATPALVAQELTDILITNGVKGIWNFAPVTLKGPKDVIIEDTHLGDSLLTLFYKLKRND